MFHLISDRAEISQVRFQRKRDEDRAGFAFRNQHCQLLSGGRTEKRPGFYAPRLQPQRDDADSEGMGVVREVEEEHQRAGASGHTRSDRLNFRLHDVIDVFAEGAEPYLIGYGNLAALPLVADAIEEWSDEAQQNIDGTQTRAEREASD